MSCPHHVIRLRGPWQYRLIDREQQMLKTGTLKVPDECQAWLQEIMQGYPSACWAKLERRFGRPTGIRPRDSIHLRIEAIPSCDEIIFNGRRLVISDPQAYPEIGARLAQSNYLELRWPIVLIPTVSFPAVQLEITHLCNDASP